MHVVSTAVGGMVSNFGRFPPPPTPPPHHHPLLGAGRPKSTAGCDPALPAGTTIFVSSGGLKQTTAASEVLSEIPDFDTSSVKAAAAADVPGSTVDQTSLPDVDNFMTLIEGAGSDDEMNDTGKVQQTNNPKSVLIALIALIFCQSECSGMNFILSSYTSLIPEYILTRSSTCVRHLTEYSVESSILRQ